MRSNLIKVYTLQRLLKYCKKWQLLSLTTTTSLTQCLANKNRGNGARKSTYIYINIYVYIGKIPCLSRAFPMFHLNLDGHVHHILDFQNQCALIPENVEQLQE